MPHNISDEWKVIRLKDISGGFVADDDWADTNDIAGWEADSQPVWYVPKVTNGISAGYLQLIVQFYDTPQTVIPVQNNTSVTVRPIALIEDSNHALGAQLLHTDSSGMSIPGAEIVQSAIPVRAAMRTGLQLASITQAPSANFIAILARMS